MLNTRLLNTAPPPRLPVINVSRTSDCKRLVSSTSLVSVFRQPRSIRTRFIRYRTDIVYMFDMFIPATDPCHLSSYGRIIVSSPVHLVANYLCLVEAPRRAYGTRRRDISSHATCYESLLHRCEKLNKLREQAAPEMLTQASLSNIKRLREYSN